MSAPCTEDGKKCCTASGNTTDALPGSGGWPLIGETPALLKGLVQFVKKRMHKYGGRFVTHVLGYWTRVSTQHSDALHALRHQCPLMSAAEGYKHLSNVGTMLPDGCSIFNDRSSGERERSRAFFSSEVARRSASRAAANGVKCKHGSDTPLYVYDELARPASEDALKCALIGSCESSIEYQWFRMHHEHWVGLQSLPFQVNIPGFTSKTPYAKGIEARDNLYKLYGKLKHERSSNGSCALDELSEPQLMLCGIPAAAKCMASLACSMINACASNGEAAETTREKVQAEVDALDLSKDINMKNEAPTLFCVMLECERMHPPFPGVVRQAQDFSAEHGCPFRHNGLVPKDDTSHLWFDIVHSNRDEEVFTDSSAFLADRWMRHTRDVSEVHLTYGGGEHECVGKEFARCFALHLTAHTLKQYKVHLRSPSTERKYLPVNKPLDGLPAQLTARDP